MKNFIYCFLLLLLVTQTKAQNWVLKDKTLPQIPISNEEDYYGYRVAIDGDYAVVGALNDAENGSSIGAAYVLQNTSSGWQNIAKLNPSDGENEDFFSSGVAISGDLIVIGASGNKQNGNNSGAVYVFTKPISGWTDMTQTAKLVASDGTEEDFFGNNIAVSGETIVASAAGNDDNGDRSGAAYVFVKPTNGWADMTQTAKLLPSDGAEGDWFGISVGISGDQIAVGAYRDDDNGENSGSAYVFVKPTNGWADMTQTAKLLPSDGAEDDWFGRSVSVSSEEIAVGSYHDGDNGENSGSAYVFVKPTNGWTDMNHTAKLLPSDGNSYDFFGIALSMSNDQILISTWRDDDNGQESGSAYIYVKPDTGWDDMTQTAKLLPSEGASYDFFGYSVAFSGDHAIVGAYANDDNGNDSGSAYLFKKPDAGWTDMNEEIKTLPNAYPDPSNTNNFYGITVAIDGNFAVVGASGDSENGSDSGAAYVLENTATGWQHIAKLTASDGFSGDKLGKRSIAISNDQIVIGAEGSNDNGEDSGAAYVFVKPSTGWTDMTQTAKLLPSDGSGLDNFGNSVAISDNQIVVGAWLNDINGNQSGSAYVFVKPESGWTDMNQSAILLPADGSSDDQFGKSVAISDNQIVIGADGDDDNGDYSGSVYVFVKPESGWTDMNQTAKLLPSDGASLDYFGHSVAISANQIVVGALSDDDNGDYSGSAYVFVKPVNGWTDMNQTAKLLSSDGESDQTFGVSVAISEDKIIVGAEGDNDNGYYSGSTYVFIKPSSGWSDMTQTDKILPSDGETEDYFGISVGISGEKIIIGAYGDDDLGNNNGSAYLYESTYILNIPPSFTIGDDQTTLEDAGNQNISNWATEITDGNNETQILTFNVTNDNNALFSVQPNIDAISGDLTYTPSENDNGSAIVTVTLSDNGGTNNGGMNISEERTFIITVKAINDAPSFTKGDDIIISEDAGNQNISGWATEINPGAQNETEQNLVFNVSNNNNSLFDSQPSIDINGDLSFTTLENANGIANITVYLNDDGGTENGGNDTSETQTFTITVNPVNDAPKISEIIIDGFCPGSSTTINLNNFTTDIDNDVATELQYTVNSSSAINGFTASINESMLILTNNGSENSNFEIEVSAIDQSGGSSSRTINISTFYLQAFINNNGNLLTATEGESYQWYLDGNILSDKTSQSMTAQLVGNYTVKVTYSGGCETISEAFFVDAKTGISSNDISDDIYVYPNPSNNHIRIKSYRQLKGKVLINLFDLNGKKIYSKTSIKEKIDITHLPNGIYILQLLNEEKFQAIKRIIKN